MVKTRCLSHLGMKRQWDVTDRHKTVRYQDRITIANRRYSSMLLSCVKINNKYYHNHVTVSYVGRPHFLYFFHGTYTRTIYRPMTKNQ